MTRNFCTLWIFFTIRWNQLSCILFCDEWPEKSILSLIDFRSRYPKRSKQRLKRLNSNHICNYDNVNWACQGWIISGGDSKIYLTSLFSVVNTGLLKTVIRLLMRSTCLTSHPWARPPLLPQPLSSSLCRTHFVHNWKSNHTNRKLSLRGGVKAQTGVFQRFQDKFLFSCSENR